MIGIGIDLCEVDRMRVALVRTPALRQRLFSHAERDRCEARADPAQCYAARFAAKEAVMKAMGVGLGACRWAEIEVVGAPGGAPMVRLHGRAAALACRLGVRSWRLSMTHTHRSAQAVAVAL